MVERVAPAPAGKVLAVEQCREAWGSFLCPPRPDGVESAPAASWAQEARSIKVGQRRPQRTVSVNCMPLFWGFRRLQ